MTRAHPLSFALLLLVGQGLCGRIEHHDALHEATSLLQVNLDAKLRSMELHSSSEGSQNQSQANQKSKGFAFVHVPYNFGNTVEKIGLFDPSMPREFMGWYLVNGIGGGSFAVPKQPASWEALDQLPFKREHPEVWGHVHPDLQATSNVSGCPLYLTPQKYWPTALAQKYIGDRAVLGILRDPYERMVAQFRGMVPGYGDDDPALRGACDLNSAVKKSLKEHKAKGDKFASACTLLPQSEFWEGKYGISRTVSNWLFPDSMNEAFKEFGYENMFIRHSDILHVSGCNDMWSGDFDAETRALIREHFQSDFDLICKELGHCDFEQSTCLNEIHHMCPDKAFTWNEGKQVYCPKPETLANKSLDVRVNPKCK